VVAKVRSGTLPDRAFGLGFAVREGGLTVAAGSVIELAD